MGYIIKEHSPLLNTKITDTARKKMSEGKFNISYFQVGDSEVCYDCVVDEDINLNMVIGAEYASSNSSSNLFNKGNVKYPLYVTSNGDNSFGIPVVNSYDDSVFNTAELRGLFSGNGIGNISVLTSDEYTNNSNKVASMSSFNGGTSISISNDTIDSSSQSTPKAGDFVSIYFNQNDTVTPISGNYPVLHYKVVSGGGSSIQVDRNLPNLSSMGYSGNARLIFYPTGMTEIYDTLTPDDYWSEGAINFECNGDTSQRDVKVWNMNIPWTEVPAGLTTSNNQVGSTEYSGTKEYLGYNSNEGQTDTDGTFYINSVSERVDVLPEDQKAIAIVHYTNNSIDDYYGEKFAMQSANGETGQARNFKVTIPWIMWHKNTTTTMGEIFYVDPPGFDSLGLFTLNYIETIGSNGEQNSKLRYYHLWDTNPNSDGYPNRVGKVWPDLKIITFDDDEIVAALSHKSNRNWTLPAPKAVLTAPGSSGGSDVGLLESENDTLWVTYRFDNDTNFTESLHCNYYVKITGNSQDCEPTTADVGIRFGQEFPFIMNGTSGSYPTGFLSNKLIILAQKVTTGNRPDPSQWKKIDVTSQISSTGWLNSTKLTQGNIIISKSDYESASTYNLSSYINLPSNGSTTGLNFGGEYLFNGTIETDIEATIYVMNYLCNLGPTQFNKSSNPTWDASKTARVTEIGLYDDEKNLMVITKVQSPEKRQGAQQYSIKLDF